MTHDKHFEILESTSCEPLLLRIENLEKADEFSLLTLDASVAAWDKCRTVLARVRSANLPALVRIRKKDWVCELEEISYLLKALRDWDQLTLDNLMELVKDYLPKEALPLFEAESKIEMKSFQEWVVAASDPRVHKYPVLPWRSFIRKVNSENYDFASGTLDLLFMYATDAEHSPELKKLIEGFLTSKKKVLCIFPKRWGKN